ncbi:MAG: c-type cytochrome [Xanthomonadales bacterium]|nr:c-type cytochrome [Xanthomonadales bacterium]
MMMRTLVLLTLLAMALLIPGPGQAQDSISMQQLTGNERAALAPTQKMIDFGRTAAETNCASCHGLDGISTEAGKPHLAGQRSVYTYRVLKAFQANVRRDEYHNDFLNDKAMLATAVYYSSLEPVQLAARDTATVQNESGAQAEEDPFYDIREVMRRCVKCHGETGNASGRGMPSLVGQDPEYFVNAMMGYVDGSRSHSLMKKLVGNLDEETIRRMGLFYAVQEPHKSEVQGDGNADTGRRLSEACESCHGGNGNASNPSMPTLAGQDAKYFIKAMQHYKDGKRQHPKMFEAVKALSEQEMIDLATYYAAEQPRRRDVRAPLKSTEWIARCERCHGIDGNSRDPRFPMLAGQDQTYLAKALKAYASGERKHSAMHAMSDSLSAMDIERISAFFASQQPKTVVYMSVPCAGETENADPDLDF